ncbi:phenolic glucoside malonyltransferase 1-like [Andrographis paniculata]|uniref:phenolic glucoside malonyltransferase 1-like n=1 Tax=Andrographis paniculata TaxID=175694 RepID=UPI0021E79392|nr:phenolic glucoside malonyltransferase 1-like [Andrographis paniculata]XP_051125228.1 phenolic glucoside malonyltransferase 1-like [Andrographis paniculata]
MCAAVLERSLIRPSPAAVTELTLPLLHFDLSWIYFPPIHRLLFFDLPHPHCSRHHFLQFIVPRLKHSLLLTLNHFLPLAGTIVHPIASSARPFSRFLLGDAVSLTIAECNKDFKHLTGNHPRVSDEFYACVPRLPPATNTPDAVLFPVLALQVTLFPDHGVCLGFANHHAIGDASTIVRFIKAWASVNRFGGDRRLIDEKSLPFYDRTSVEDPDGLDSTYWNLLKKPLPVEPRPPPFPLNKVRATFVITRDDVEKIKGFLLTRRPEMHITAFTVTCALVWVCLVKAETEAVADDEPEYFGFAADCRGRLNPPLPATYFGNCLAFVKAESTHGLLRGKDGFMVAAERLGQAIQKTVYNEKGILDGAEHWPAEFRKLKGKRLFGVAGSPRFDLYDADYGWGRARKFESASIDGETSMSLCKSRDCDGGLEFTLSRPKNKLDAFAAVFTLALRKL